MSDTHDRPGLVDDARSIVDAAALIRLGARLQVLECELALPRGRLVRLHREVCGTAPQKGLLPFSSDWYMTWMANLHASLFYGIYRFLRNEARCRRLDALVKAYGRYAGCCNLARCEPMLNLTRAWMLVRFVDGGELDTVRCAECGARFIAYRHGLRRRRCCVACRLPARAGKRAGGVLADAG